MTQSPNLSVPAPPPLVMDWLSWREGQLFGEDVSLNSIAAQFGTPTYVYSRRAIEAAYLEFASACADRPKLICFALKANSNLAVIEILSRLGAGFDVVSGGELERVVAAGGDPRRAVFSGVGKREDEIRLALELGIRCFNVESIAELQRLSRIGQSTGRSVPVSLRINPDVDPRTHPYISTGLRESKFGIAWDQALDAYCEAAGLPGLKIVGVDCHIGSQITEVTPFLAALDRLLLLVGRIEAVGIELEHIDLGGGLGIRYDLESPPARSAMIAAVLERLDAHPIGRRLEVMFEFGRSLVGNAGLLLSRVEHLKDNGGRGFAIVDAAMNDLLRPALYEAWHGVVPVRATPAPGAQPGRWDLVGPVCESGDWLARGRELILAEDDLLAFQSAGAYGMVMASNYNSRPRAAEVLIDGEDCYEIRRREQVHDLFALESRLR